VALFAHCLATSSRYFTGMSRYYPLKVGKMAQKQWILAKNSPKMVDFEEK